VTGWTFRAGRGSTPAKWGMNMRKRTPEEKKARRLRKRARRLARMHTRTQMALGHSGNAAPSQKEIDAFYESWDWKRLRYEFIRGQKRRCQCCGATPLDGIRIVVDHIRPIRRFWSARLDIRNLQLLCDPCNQGKGSHDTTDWRPADEFAWLAAKDPSPVTWE
jgi:5-methylcytosine-specific restriction endonuclease McrA